MDAAMSQPLLGYACLGFFLVCVVLAIATWLVFKSGEKGTTKLGGVAGCAIGAALVVIAGMMAVGALVFAGVGLRKDARERGRVHVEDLFGDEEEDETTDDAMDEGSEDEPETVDAADLVQVEVVADVNDPSEIGPVIDRLRDLTEGDFSTHLETVRDGNASRTELRVTISVAEGRVDELKTELERAWPGLLLPHGGKLEVREL